MLVNNLASVSNGGCLCHVDIVHIWRGIIER